MSKLISLEFLIENAQKDWLGRPKSKTLRLLGFKGSDLPTPAEITLVYSRGRQAGIEAGIDTGKVITYAKIFCKIMDEVCPIINKL